MPHTDSLSFTSLYRLWTHFRFFVHRIELLKTPFLQTLRALYLSPLSYLFCYLPYYCTVHMHSTMYAMAPCLSIHLKPMFYRNRQMNRAAFDTDAQLLPSAHSTVCYIGVRLPPETMVLSSGTLSQTLNVADFYGRPM